MASNNLISYLSEILRMITFKINNLLIEENFPSINPTKINITLHIGIKPNGIKLLNGIKRLNGIKPLNGTNHYQIGIKHLHGAITSIINLSGTKMYGMTPIFGTRPITINQQLLG